MTTTSSPSRDARTTKPIGLPEALKIARDALAPHADPTAPDGGTQALLHGALTLIEAAQRSLDTPADPLAEVPRRRRERTARAA